MPVFLASIFGQHFWHKMNDQMNDMTAPTIYACATAPGRAALAVVRVSGPDCRAVLSGFGAACPPPREACLRRLTHPHSQDLLDEALVLYFAGPHSYTGEDVVELHLHGGVAVVASVLDALAALPNCRPAEAGEFTRRAVLHGKLDLTRAEAVADLIDAETTAQQIQALGQLQGNLRDLFEGWRGELHTALAHLEADLEFADEDLPGGIGRAALGTLPICATKLPFLLTIRAGCNCAPACAWPCWARRMRANPACSTGWPGATPPLCRPAPAPRATLSRLP